MKAVSSTQKREKRSIHTEGKDYYLGLKKWQQSAVDLVFSVYGVYTKYAELGYKFEYSFAGSPGSFRHGDAFVHRAEGPAFNEQFVGEVSRIIFKQFQFEKKSIF